MPHFSVTHAVPGAVVESIVLDAPMAGAACTLAAEWLSVPFPDILVGQVTLESVRQINDREAWSPVTDERQVLPDERCNVAVHSVR